MIKLVIKSNVNWLRSDIIKTFNCKITQLYKRCSKYPTMVQIFEQGGLIMEVN